MYASLAIVRHSLCADATSFVAVVIFIYVEKVVIELSNTKENKKDNKDCKLSGGLQNVPVGTKKKESGH
ncbi:hypothetical protein PUN28_003757 [Cardiocondyla obscurior]|uniref:Uncharacterized protein n=1 Tax=Cardiocondyla obscurior TaxID=286306 RepID=A0AAW2GP40_9HYME